MSTETFWYDAKAARWMSGIAILLMIAHHFFCFPSYLLPDVHWASVGAIAGIEVERVVGAFGKICVSIFAFNSGYVLFVKNTPPLCVSCKNLIDRELCTRMLRFLLNYWVVCLLFLSFALATGDSLPDMIQFFWNLVGLKTGPHFPWVNVPFAWYVAYYVCFLLLSKWIVMLFTGEKASVDILKLLILFMIVQLVCRLSILDFLGPLSVGAAGFLVAKWHWFERMDRLFGKRYAGLYAIMILGVVVFRQGLILLLKDSSLFFVCSFFELLWVVLFIYASVSILVHSVHQAVHGMLQYLGKYSMNMWFIHGIFFTGSCCLQPYVYDLHYSPLIFIVGVLSSLILSIITDRIQGIVLSKMIFLNCR